MFRYSRMSRSRSTSGWLKTRSVQAGEKMSLTKGLSSAGFRAAVRRIRSTRACGMAVVQVDEGFGGTLPAAHDRDPQRLAGTRGQVPHALEIVGMVEQPRLPRQGREHGRDVRRPARADDHGPGAAHLLEPLRVARADLQELDPPALEDRLHRRHLLAVAALVGEVRGHPAQVVVVLHPAGIEGAEIDEVDQPVVPMKIVDEAVEAGRIPQGDEILEERDLHLAA